MNSITVQGITFTVEDCRKCPHNGSFALTSPCAHCPIFLCWAIEDTDGSMLRMVEPEDYRKDWAEAFRKWMDGGYKGELELPLDKDSKK